MATLTCINCGQRGSDTDAFCTRCGMPRGGGRPVVPHASAGGGGGSGSRTLGWVAVAAAVLFGGVFVVGILAAIAIPKFANVSKAAKEAEAAPYLEQIRTLQESYHQEHGRYTANLEDPQSPGFLAGYPDVPAKYYVFSVSRADADALCIEAHPSGEGREAGLFPTSMDAAGTQYRGPNCVDIPEQGWDVTAEDVANTEARPTLERVHTLQAQFRKSHGRYTRDLAELPGGDSVGTTFFTFAVTRATSRELCVDARLTPVGRSAGLAESSIDHRGTRYLGTGCSGTRLTSGGPKGDEAAEETGAAEAP